jgi:hypothetical protein
MILLFPKYKLIYFSVPKAACTSIKTALLSLEGIENTTGQLGFVHSKDAPFTWVRYKERARIFEEYPDYFKFAFVRNPWDRLVSFYSDKIVERTQRYGELIDDYINLGFSKDMDFETCVRHICNIDDEKADIHFRSQHTLILANKNIDRLDFIGHFETICEDWLKLKQMLPHATASVLDDLKHLHISSHDNFKKYYSQEFWDLVAERYRDDIALFGYQHSCLETN